MLKKAVVLTSILLIGACSPDEAGFVSAAPTFALERLAGIIAEAGPRIVIANEDHHEPRSRYVSACLLEALSREMTIEVFAAETFAGSGVIVAGDDLSQRLSGAYLNRAHFVDLLHAAGPDRALLAYDAPAKDEQLDAGALRRRGLTPGHWNGRERTSAERIASVLGALDGAKAFVHVGQGHGRRLWHEADDGAHARLGGHLVAIGIRPLVSVTTIAQPPAHRRACPATINFSTTALVADLEAGTFECASKVDPPDGPIGYDVFILDNYPAADERGYVTQIIAGCTLRQPVSLPVPQDARRAGEAAVTVFQWDSYGRRVGTWSGEWRAEGAEASLRAILLDTGSAHLSWSWPQDSGARAREAAEIEWTPERVNERR